MRILHVVHSFAPETHGGTQAYVEAVARLQQADGADVAVLAGSRRSVPGGELVEQRHNGLSVWRLHRDPAERLAGDLGSAAVAAMFVAVLQRFRPTLVHVHHWQTLSNDLVRTAVQAGVPVVVTLHDLFVTCARSFRLPDHRSPCPVTTTLAECALCVAADVAEVPTAVLVSLLEARAAAFRAELGAAASVLAVSRAQQQLLAAVPGGPRDLSVLPIARPWPYATMAAPPPAPRLRIANWGGLDPRKGVHLLLAAIAGSTLRARFELHLHGAPGEAGYMEELQRLAAGLDVTFHGPFADAELPGFGGRYDLAVFPFLAFETHGLAVDEALHMGLPVVVSDRGAPPERIGARGISVPPGDVAALRTALELLATDRERLAALRAAPHRASTLGSHHDALRQVYAAALAAPVP